MNETNSLDCMSEKLSLDELKQKFLKEIEGITDIDELKEVYAREIARRDKILLDLQEQNKLILKSAFKTKSEDLKHND
jgi:hypothetical protein